MRPVLYNYYSLKITYNKDINQYQQDGLPNITGNFSKTKRDVANGSFYFIGSGGVNSMQATSGSGSIVGFSASRSNSIYGSSSYVQPKNVSMLPILKY